LFESVRHLAEAGFALHPLRERSKAPVEDLWSTAPVYTYTDLKRLWRPGFNVGLRLGEPSRVGGYFLHVIDLDIRDPALADEARRALVKILPEFATLPTVISGSGGDSRHFYLLAHEPFRSRKLAHADHKIAVFEKAKNREVKKWAWEIELFGTGKQVAIPPSIHPDTGAEYVWSRPFDLDLVEMGLGPVVGCDRIRGWIEAAGGIAQAAAEPSDDTDDDDLSAELHKQPMDLTREEIHRALYDLPVDGWCEDRDGWLNVGMALHHQFQGSEEGLNLWNEFSARSKKYDARDQSRVWNSFRVTAKSMRFASRA
jgi:hypothetical protein